MSKRRKGVNPEAVEKGNPKSLSAKTSGQREYIRAICENNIVIATGPAGTGKTAVAVAMACQAFLNGDIERIIITRPCVEANGRTTNNFGALPGSLEEKIAPYLRPAYEELEKFLGRTKYNEARSLKVVEVSPLEFMQGRTFNDAYMILDEAQNCTTDQLKMFITRMGENSKVLINGDAEQTNLKLRSELAYPTDLEYVCDKLYDVDGVAIVKLYEADIVRNDMIARVLRALRRK